MRKNYFYEIKEMIFKIKIKLAKRKCAKFYILCFGGLCEHPCANI